MTKMTEVSKRQKLLFAQGRQRGTIFLLKDVGSLKAFGDTAVEIGKRLDLPVCRVARYRTVEISPSDVGKLESQGLQVAII